MNRPCTACGEPHEGNGKCTECRREDHRPRAEHRTYQGTHRWTQLSAHMRRDSPFCELCSSTDHLEVDHVLPSSEFPELVYVRENLRVLCRRCNRSRGGRWTTEEAHGVLTRLQAAYRIRPKVNLGKAIRVAQRAAEVGGGPPAGGSKPRPVAAEGVAHPGGASW